MRGVVSVSLGIPVEVLSLLPAANGCFEAVTEVIFAVGGGGDFVPGEVDAAAGSAFADGVEQVHCRRDGEVDLGAPLL